MASGTSAMLTAAPFALDIYHNGHNPLKIAIGLAFSLASAMPDFMGMPVGVLLSAAMVAAGLKPPQYFYLASISSRTHPVVQFTITMASLVFAVYSDDYFKNVIKRVVDRVASEVQASPRKDVNDYTIISLANKGDFSDDNILKNPQALYAIIPDQHKHHAQELLTINSFRQFIKAFTGVATAFALVRKHSGVSSFKTQDSDYSAAETDDETAYTTSLVDEETREKEEAILQEIKDLSKAQPEHAEAYRTVETILKQIDDIRLLNWIGNNTRTVANAITETAVSSGQKPRQHDPNSEPPLEKKVFKLPVGVPSQQSGDPALNRFYKRPEDAIIQEKAREHMEEDAHRIVEAIIRDIRDPHLLDWLANNSHRVSQAMIMEAVEGARKEHLRAPGLGQGIGDLFNRFYKTPDRTNPSPNPQTSATMVTTTLAASATGSVLKHGHAELLTSSNVPPHEMFRYWVTQRLKTIDEFQAKATHNDWHAAWVGIQFVPEVLQDAIRAIRILKEAANTAVTCNASSLVVKTFLDSYCLAYNLVASGDCGPCFVLMSLFEDVRRVIITYGDTLSFVVGASRKAVGSISLKSPKVVSELATIQANTMNQFAVPSNAHTAMRALLYQRVTTIIEEMRSEYGCLDPHKCLATYEALTRVISVCDEDTLTRSDYINTFESAFTSVESKVMEHVGALVQDESLGIIVIL